MGIQAKNTDVNKRLIEVEKELKGPFLDVFFLINQPLTNPILSLNYIGPDYEVIGKALEIRNFYETAEDFYTIAKLTIYIDGIEQTKGDNSAIKWISPTQIQVNGNLYPTQKVMVKYSPLGRTKANQSGITEFFYIDEPVSLPANSPLSTGGQSLAIGDGAQSRVDKTINLSGAIITKNITASGNVFDNAVLHGSGAIVTVTSPLLNLLTTGTNLISIPNNSRFWVNTVSIVLVRYNLTSLTSVANISIGTTGQPTLIANALDMDNLTATHERETITHTCRTGLDNLLFTVNTAAVGVGTTYTARVSYSGFLMESEL